MASSVGVDEVSTVGIKESDRITDGGLVVIGAGKVRTESEVIDSVVNLLVTGAGKAGTEFEVEVAEINDSQN